METVMSEERRATESTNDRGRIRMFILSRFPLAKEMSLNDDDHLLNSGVVDSLGILEIVSFLSEEFGIEVVDDDLQPENFESIVCLERFVQRKRGSSPE
jgi:acyl carrier protein